MQSAPATRWPSGQVVQVVPEPSAFWPAGQVWHALSMPSRKKVPVPQQTGDPPLVQRRYSPAEHVPGWVPQAVKVELGW